MAAAIKTIINIYIFNIPSAEKVAAANINESPGRNGVTTRPVSKNIIQNNIRYVSNP